MTIKQKIVSVTGKLSTKSVDGERRIVFVASSNNEDRHYEHVDVASLRLPLKGGGDITVSAIPSEGVSEVIDIPLMLNHSGDVRDVIGSIRAAYFSNNELTFEAGISKREIAQEMLTLLEEGHLSNAFSITMIDYDYNIDSETISKAEVIEVSLVYRGSNKEARLLAIKSLLGDEMKTKQNDNFGDANGDGENHTVIPEATEAPETVGETPAGETEAPKAPDNSEEEAANESEGETQEVLETNNTEEKEETMKPTLTDEQINKINEEYMKLANASTEAITEAGSGFEFSNKTKIIAYLIGDFLLLGSAITPQVVLAIMSLNDKNMTAFGTALASILATLGSQILLIFKLLKKKK